MEEKVEAKTAKKKVVKRKKTVNEVPAKKVKVVKKEADVEEVIPEEERILEAMSDEERKAKIDFKRTDIKIILIALGSLLAIELLVFLATIF